MGPEHVAIFAFSLTAFILHLGGKNIQRAGGGCVQAQAVVWASSCSVIGQALAPKCSLCSLAKRPGGGWHPPQWLNRPRQGEKVNTVNTQMKGECSLVFVSLNLRQSTGKPTGLMLFLPVAWSHPSTTIYTNESFWVFFGGGYCSNHLESQLTLFNYSGCYSPAISTG